MATFLDDRYVLLAERSVHWLPRTFDGWDLTANCPITTGYFEAGEPLPILPAAQRLQHPSILGLSELRHDEDGALWAIWPHFGAVGADLLAEHPVPMPAVLWIAHEVATALLYARGAAGRHGGFRLPDFAPDQVRLLDDGAVRVVGFGRLGLEAGREEEFSALGRWVGDWIARSGDEDAEDAQDVTVAATLLGTLQWFDTADANAPAVVPRILAGLRPGTEGGPEALARFVRRMSASRAVDWARMLAAVDAQPAAEHERVVTHVVEQETDTRALPPVRIAPRMSTPKRAPTRRTRKGIPSLRRSWTPRLLLALAILAVIFGGWRAGLFGGGDAPQVLLETRPAGASVFLDDTLLLEQTPLALNDLPIGWHRVRFMRAEFPPIDDSFLVYKSGSHRPLEFVFTRTVRIESLPAGAGVYLNGKRAPQLTPFVEAAWPVTDPMSLVMHLEQYGTIEDCVLDPVYGTVEVRDPAAWQVDALDSVLVVRGLFVHSVAFYASPPDARLYVDDTLVVDPTGGKAYSLTFGPHRLRAEAIGFDPLDTTMVVSSRTPPFVPVVLARPVRISAFDPRQPQSDLRVLVDRLEGPDRTIYVRRFTPYSVRIPAVAHTATLRKRDYRDTTVYIPPDLTSVTVFMTPVGGMADAAYRPEPEVPVTRSVPDRVVEPTPRATTEHAPWIRIQISVRGRQSLEGAEIWARASDAMQETFLGTTDAKGELRAQMAQGNYDLLAYLDLYSGIRKRVKVRAARNRPITIELDR